MQINSIDDLNNINIKELKNFDYQNLLSDGIN
jgi:hypothetical protein